MKSSTGIQYYWFWSGKNRGWLRPDAENREFEGKDEMYTPSTHTFSETRRAQLSVDIWVEGVLISSWRHIRSVKCVDHNFGLEFSTTELYRQADVLNIQYSGTAFMKWNAHSVYIWNAVYWNFLLYSTIDSDLAKIEDDCDLTQKIVNSREKMRCTPLRPIYRQIAARV